MIDIISFLGMLSVIMIFINIKQANKFNIYLGFFFLSMLAFILSHKIISLTSNYYVISFSILFLSGIVMCTGPMLYFYTNGILNREKKNLLYYIHFLPLLLILIDLIPFFLKPREHQYVFYKMIQVSLLSIYKIDTLFVEIQFFFLFRFISGIIYAIWCILTTYRLRKYFFEKKKGSFNIEYYWILYLSGSVLIIFTLLLLSILIIRFFSTTKILDLREILSPDFVNYLYEFGVISSLIFIPSILFNPRILFSEKSTNTTEKKKKKNQLKDFESNSFEESILPLGNQLKIESVNPSNFIQIAEKLALYFFGKPYLQPGFSLSTITNETDIPYHKVTSYFTVYLGVPFNDWKNDKRIEHAIELIKEGQAKNQTIESISYSCGFLSRSNFVNSFKKKTGLTPSEYIKTMPEGNLVFSSNF